MNLLSLLSTIFLFLNILTVSGQTKYVKYFPSYPDHKIISFFKDSLKSTGIQDSFITFLTQDKKEEITYLIWIENNKMNVIRITNSTISKPIKYQPQNFLTLLDFSKLAILESENTLRFMPPVNPLNTNIALIDSISKRYIIEFGSNSNYILNSAKAKDRAHFFQVLAQDLKPLERKWQTASLYKRLP